MHHLYGLENVETRSVEKTVAWPVITRVALMHRVATDNDFLREAILAERKWPLHGADASRHPSRFLSDNVAFKTVY